MEGIIKIIRWVIGGLKIRYRHLGETAQLQIARSQNK